MISNRLILLVLCLVWWFLLPSQWFSYFENKFLCTIEDTSITVSLTDWEKPCFSYISKVAAKIATLEEDITIAQQYIDANRDVDYWTALKETLDENRATYEFSRNQIVTSMDDYENELFLRIKVLVYSHLKSEREETEQKIKQADMLLLRMKLSWNDEQYPTVITKRNQLYREWLLLDAIKRSGSFEELLFPLKSYLDSQTEV